MLVLAGDIGGTCTRLAYFDTADGMLTPLVKLAEMGTDWLKSLKSLLLRVPSAVIPNEDNLIINPMHADVKYVKISHVEDFTYDKRLHL